MTTTATALAPAATQSTPDIQQSSQQIFTTTTLPPDGVTLNGEKYFLLSQICRHLGIGRNALYVAVKNGRLKTVFRPGLTKKIKLVHQDELRRFLNS